MLFYNAPSLYSNAPNNSEFFTFCPSIYQTSFTLAARTIFLLMDSISRSFHIFYLAECRTGLSFKKENIIILPIYTIFFTFILLLYLHVSIGNTCSPKINIRDGFLPVFKISGTVGKLVDENFVSKKVVA